MKAPDISVLKEAYFAIYFDKKGNPIHVVGPEGTKDSAPPKATEINEEKKVEVTFINKGEETDPHCMKVGNRWVCKED